MDTERSTSSHPLEIFFRHNLWSNLRLFDACLELTGEQLDQGSAGSFGSIRATLHHLTAAEERYIFHITSGKLPGELEKLTAKTPLDKLRDRVKSSGETLLDLATSLDGKTKVLIQGDDYSEWLPIEALLLQVIHHAHEHRTQIESMFGQLGLDPPGLSGWRYFDEKLKE